MIGTLTSGILVRADRATIDHVTMLVKGYSRGRVARFLGVSVGALDRLRWGMKITRGVLAEVQAALAAPHFAADPRRLP